MGKRRRVPVGPTAWGLAISRENRESMQGRTDLEDGGNFCLRDFLEKFLALTDPYQPTFSLQLGAHSPVFRLVRLADYA